MRNSGLNETATRPAAERAAVEVRDLTLADLPVVVAIERRSFGSPWTPGMFVLEISRGSGVALAAQCDGRVMAYLVLSRYDRAWHLMNVAVDPEFRRRGLATKLVNEALDRIGPDAPVTLEVRPSNGAAISLYGALGFRPFGHRPGYYPDNGEDALIMWRGDPADAGVPDEAFPGR
jgi:[ribosomal protein S18]-alanine N-acetyltransferase